MFGEPFDLGSLTEGQSVRIAAANYPLVLYVVIAPPDLRVEKDRVHGFEVITNDKRCAHRAHRGFTLGRYLEVDAVWWIGNPQIQSHVWAFSPVDAP